MRRGARYQAWGMGHRAWKKVTNAKTRHKVGGRLKLERHQAMDKPPTSNKLGIWVL